MSEESGTSPSLRPNAGASEQDDGLSAVSTVEKPSAFLVTTTTRLCINATQSAHSRHEIYVGVWLPEPVDTSGDPLIGAEHDEALRLAVLLLFEKLSPSERAAFVLREAFEYSYGQISEILQMDEANVRQLVSRAHKHVTDLRHASVDLSEQRRLLEAFIAAARRGDMIGLEGLLAADVVSYSDGGGLVRAAGTPVSGRKRVATFVASVSTLLWKGVTVSWVETNGQAAVLLSRNWGTRNTRVYRCLRRRNPRNHVVSETKQDRCHYKVRPYFWPQ